MSHVSTLKVEITDLECVEQACEDLGLCFRRGQRKFKNYAGRRSPCDHAIAMPGTDAYEIGLVRNQGDEESYSLAFDSWQGGKGMMDRVGKNCTKLRQAYSHRKAVKQADSLGWKVREERQQDGSIKLFCTPKATATAKASW